MRDEFIREAIWHGSLDKAREVFVANPEIAGADIHVAAILGDDVAVRALIAADRANVQARSGPYFADALNYLGLSKYLRLEPERTPAFVRAAAALLDAGANPNTGFWTTGEFPEYESAMYGAAGVAHNPEITRLLLERGADPNDGEVTYHSPETNDNRVLHLLVETGRLTPESLGTMLIRKIDWHDHDGVRYLLEHAAPADGARERGWRALHHALARGNALDVIKMLLDHGADPMLTSGGLTGVERAAAEGRADVLAEFKSRGIPTQLDGVAAFVAACATGDAARVHAIASENPALVPELIARGGTLLARFAGNGNLEGVRALLDLGVSATTPFDEGDGYFGITRGTLPIYIAAKRGRPAIVQLLIERGSPTDQKVDELLKLEGRWW